MLSASSAIRSLSCGKPQMEGPERQSPNKERKRLLDYCYAGPLSFQTNLHAQPWLVTRRVTEACWSFIKVGGVPKIQPSRGFDSFVFLLLLNSPSLSASLFQSGLLLFFASVSRLTLASLHFFITIFNAPLPVPKKIYSKLPKLRPSRCVSPLPLSPAPSSCLPLPRAVRRLRLLLALRSLPPQPA
jgi:hypothetical protein